MKRLLAAVAGAVVMGACTETATAPVTKKAPAARPLRDEITCRSGYVIAYDENGNPYCAPAGEPSAPSPQP